MVQLPGNMGDGNKSHFQLDVIKAIRQYCIEATEIARGMKVLLLDDETTFIISLVLGQLEILQREVYLFEKISTENREPMPYLHAICFFRPTDKNLLYIKKELQNPKYGEYYLFFTNTVSEEYMRQLAEADELEVVKEVQEFYADYCSINPDTWALNLFGPGVLSSTSQHWPHKLSRITDGITSLLLSLKIRPHIRFQCSSSLALKVAQSVKARIKDSSTFHVGHAKTVSPLLIIMDRFEDPITPLLTTWTYQAMCHQLIGINNNRLDMSHVAGIREELKQVVLSTMQDDFFLKHMYDVFGDLGVAIKKFVDDFQAESQTHSKLNSIEDIKRFVEKYPDFRRISGNVSKHVAIMSELQHQVQARRLLDVSPVEQKLACHENNSDAVESVRNILMSEPRISPDDALRIVLLYALRYAQNSANQLNVFVQILTDVYKIPAHRLVVIRLLREFTEDNKRTVSLDLYEKQDWLTSVRGKIKRGLVGITNVFTQHSPLLKKILSLLKENKLDHMDYPFILGEASQTPPTEILVFIVGGATYEEAALIHRMNSEDDSTSYLLGSTGMLTPKQFINELLAT